MSFNYDMIDGDVDESDSYQGIAPATPIHFAADST
jgi:hypothetical protein